MKPTTEGTSTPDKARQNLPNPANFRRTDGEILVFAIRRLSQQLAAADSLVRAIDASVGFQDLAPDLREQLEDYTCAYPEKT